MDWSFIQESGLLGALEHEFYDFPFSWEFHHPNWRSPSFFRGVGQPPTSYIFLSMVSDIYIYTIMVKHITIYNITIVTSRYKPDYMIIWYL